MTTNTSALPALPHTADTRSMTERVNAMLRNLYNKILPVGAANTVLTSNGTTFSWVAPAAAFVITGATTYAGADVALNNSANFFNGPNTGALVAGTYLLMAKAQFVDTGGPAAFIGQIHDGTNAVDTGRVTSGAANQVTTLTLGKVVVISISTTFTLQAKDATATTGVLQRSETLASTANLSTSITAVRLA